MGWGDLMQLIYLPLALLLIVAVVSQGVAVSSSFGSVTGDPLVGNLTEGGESTELGVEGYDINVGFTAQDGILAFIVAMIAVGALIGINVVGSGLSDTSVMIVYKSVAFFGLWGLISVFSFGGINAIPLVGWFLYFVLTFVYGLGVFQQIGGV